MAKLTGVRTRSPRSSETREKSRGSRSDRSTHPTKKTTERIEVLRELFTHPLETRVFRQAGIRKGWTDVSNVDTLLLQIRRRLLERIGESQEEPLLAVQKVLLEGLFDILGKITNQASTRQEIGVALVDLLNLISSLMKITSIGSVNREFDRHVDFMRLAVNEGQFRLVADTDKRTFVIMRGRRPSKHNQALYKAFDLFKKPETKHLGAKVSERQAVELYEKSIGRRFPFTQREWLIESYRARNRRLAQQDKK